MLGLCQYDKKSNLLYKGQITLRISNSDFKIIVSIDKIDLPLFKASMDNEKAVWIKPVLVCTVRYMGKTTSVSLRQPIYKGLRFDNEPTDCLK